MNLKPPGSPQSYSKHEIRLYIQCLEKLIYTSYDVQKLHNCLCESLNIYNESLFFINMHNEFIIIIFRKAMMYDINSGTTEKHYIG